MELEHSLSGGDVVHHRLAQLQVGFNNAYLHHENTDYTDPGAPYSYSFANGVPNQITYRIVPRTIKVNVDYDFGVFAQDRWTIGRWTLAGGIRYDAFANSYPEQSIAPTVLAPALNIRFDEVDNLKWKDITPKMGATYDLFGNGRTALKVTLNKYSKAWERPGPAVSPTCRTCRIHQPVEHPDDPSLDRQWSEWRNRQRLFRSATSRTTTRTASAERCSMPGPLAISTRPRPTIPI